MNIKTLLLVPSAIALSLSCLSVLPVTAQTTTAPANRMERGWSQLNLSDAQKTQIKQIREQAKADMQKQLSPAQLSQLQAAKQSGNKRAGMKALNLSEQQKQAMKQIKDRERQQIQAILTPEQRQQLEQQRANANSRRQQRQQQPGQSQ